MSWHGATAAENHPSPGANEPRWFHAQDAPQQQLPPDELLPAPVILLQQLLPSPGDAARRSMHSSQQVTTPPGRPGQPGVLPSAHGMPWALADQLQDDRPPAQAFSDPSRTSGTLDRPPAADREGVISCGEGPVSLHPADSGMAPECGFCLGPMRVRHKHSASQSLSGRSWRARSSKLQWHSLSERTDSGRGACYVPTKPSQRIK